MQDQENFLTHLTKDIYWTIIDTRLKVEVLQIMLHLGHPMGRLTIQQNISGYDFNKIIFFDKKLISTHYLRFGFFNQL